MTKLAFQIFATLCQKMSQDDAEEAEKSSEEVSSKLETIPPNMKLKIEEMYRNLVHRYFSRRAQFCLSEFHMTNFIHGVWLSIIQCKQNGITKFSLDGEYNPQNLDLFFEIVHSNVLFFLNDFGDESRELGENLYIDFIKENL